MGCIEFAEKVTSLFESYLLRRTFKANNDDKNFLDLANSTCDFPQESLLGPLLLLLYYRLRKVTYFFTQLTHVSLSNTET